MVDKEIDVPDNDASADDWAEFFEGLEEMLIDEAEDAGDWSDEELDELFGPEE